jgi:hypothetical protein
MTLLVIAQCPRHNCKGVSFLDYGHQDYHIDTYFDDFGGYDMFRFLLLNHPSEELSRVVGQLIGGEKFLSLQENETTCHIWLRLSDADRGRYLDRMVEYWTEVHEQLDRILVELPSDVRETLKERREQHNAKYKLPEFHESDIKQMPWEKEVQEILNGKWSGKFHWIVDE